MSPTSSWENYSFIRDVYVCMCRLAPTASQDHQSWIQNQSRLSNEVLPTIKSRSLRGMVKGGEVLLVLPGVSGSVETIGSHVGIGGLHGEIGNGTNSGDTSSHRHSLGVLKVQQLDQVSDVFDFRYALVDNQRRRDGVLYNAGGGRGRASGLVANLNCMNSTRFIDINNGYAAVKWSESGAVGCCDRIRSARRVCASVSISCRVLFQEHNLLTSPIQNDRLVLMISLCVFLQDSGCN